RSGYLRFNIGAAVKAPRVALDPDARSLSEMQIAGMIHEARRTLGDEQQLAKPRSRYLRVARLRLSLLLWMYYSGCRVSEVARARWEDVHLRADGDYSVSVLGKGTRRRAVPMPMRVIEEVADGHPEGR